MIILVYMNLIFLVFNIHSSNFFPYRVVLDCQVTKVQLGHQDLRYDINLLHYGINVDNGGWSMKLWNYAYDKLIVPNVAWNNMHYKLSEENKAWIMHLL